MIKTRTVKSRPGVGFGVELGKFWGRVVTANPASCIVCTPDDQNPGTG